MITRIQAIKRYLGEKTPIENSELIALKKSDPAGFKWLGDASAKMLGETITE